MPTLPVYTDLDMQSTNRLTNLPDPSAAQHAATKAYVDANIEGLNWKDSVRAASTANLTISGPGATIDGVTMAANDRFLAKNQSTASENGIYIWNGSAVAATRALDMNSAAEVEAAVALVEEGTTNAGTTWRQTAVNVTLGSTSLAWTTFGTAAGAASEASAGIAEIATQAETNTGTDDARFVTPLKLMTFNAFNKTYSATIGDGSTTQFDLTHGLSTVKTHQVFVYETGGSFRQVLVEVQMLSTTQVRVIVSPAPATNALTVVVQGTDN